VVRGGAPHSYRATLSCWRLRRLGGWEVERLGGWEAGRLGPGSPDLRVCWENYNQTRRPCSERVRLFLPYLAHQQDGAVLCHGEVQILREMRTLER